MYENEEDIEEFDSDSDGEVKNMASDLMYSTPSGASPTTLSSSSFLSTSTQSKHTPYKRTWRTSEGKESK